MASEPITSPMMNIPVPQSGGAGNSSSASAPKPQAKPSTPSKSSFADELAKNDAADSAQPKKALPEKPKTPVGDRDERGATEKLSDKTAADAKEKQAKAQESAKKLEPLKKAAANSKQAIENAPVVALLTGHLEKVQPTEIPDLVTGNAFLADAIGEGDIAAFMNKPAKIGDILDDLELPQGLADIAQDMGLDLSHVVTPSELLRAIGVDPGKVTAELTNLKSSLGMEGLAPYMKKAAQLAEQSGAQAQQPLEPYPGWAKTTTPPAVPQSPVTGAFDPTKMGQPGSPVQPVVPGGKASAAPAALSQPNLAGRPQGAALTLDELQDLTARSSAMGLSPDQLLRILTPGMAADAVKRPGEHAKNLAPGAQPLAGLGGLGAAPQTSTLDLTSLMAMQNANAVPANASVAPSMNQATFDAFHLLGDKLKTMDTQSVDMTQVQQGTVDQLAQASTQTLASAGRSLEEQLTSLGHGLNPGRTQQPELKIGGESGVKTPTGPEVKPETNVADLRAAKPELDVRPSDVMERIAAKPTAFAQGATQPLVKDVAPKLNLAQAMPADDLRLAAPVMAGKGGDAGAQDFGGQGRDERPKDEGFSLTGVDRAFGELHAGKAQHAAPKQAFALGNAPEVGLTSAERLNLFQQVMDRATSLMKDGGGTVRLDFGSAGLGQLEMAVKMNDDKMDLKILTGSDRVREAMMSELGRLRDALSVQNVQLGQVDVGVGGRQHQPQGFNFAQGGHQQPQQAFQQAFQDGQRRGRSPSQLLDVERLAEIRRPMPAFAASQLMNHSSGGAGRITVRV